MNVPGRNDLELLRFLRSALAEPLPEDLTTVQDEAVIAERLCQVAGSDDEWIARASEHERWIGQTMQLGAPTGERLPGRPYPLDSRLRQASGMAVGLGRLSGLAHLTLEKRDDLEPNVRELLDDALRDAAAGAARAWARIDQASCLLATIDEATDER